MKRLSSVLSAFLVVFSLAGVVAVAIPQPVSAAACSDRLLTFPTWYRGISKTVDGSCEIVPPTQADGSLSKFIWTIVLNVIEILMQLVGYASVVFLIIGGFRYITATGDANKMTSAKNTIMNAMIGLAITLASVAIVNVVAAAL